MLERSERILKIVGIGLAVFLVFQVTRIVARVNTAAAASIPEIPSWSPRSGADSNATVRATGSGPPGGVPAGVVPPGAMPPRGRPPGSGRPGGGSVPDLPPAVRQRVDRVVQSGVLGPVVRPPPMALLGIGGDRVFLRAPNGQTGLIKEGDELGGVRLLRIGTNRVLVEENGQSKELMIFGGLGGQGLMPPPNPPHP